MSYKWLPEEEHLLKLMRAKHTISEIADEFKRRADAGINGFRTARTIKAIERKCESCGWTKESLRDYTAEKNEYHEKFKVLRELQAGYNLPSVTRSRGLIPEGKIARKIVSISDIHFPFAREDMLEKILKENDDADILVLNGDILEGYVFSTFTKSRRISALIEYNTAFEFVRLCSEMFPAVYLVDGNHDVRAAKAVKRQGLEVEASQVLRPNLISRIANGERLDETGMLVEKLDFDNVFYEPRESWYVRIGKTVFVHPHGSTTSAPGFKVKKVNMKFRERYEPDEYDSIVCGHTHQIYKGIVNGRLLIEQGCLAGLLGYSNAPDFKYNTSPMNGYAIIYQDKDGNTDFNWSGPVFLGEALPPKKDVLA